jgi:hypothetical protein
MFVEIPKPRRLACDSSRESRAAHGAVMEVDMTGSANTALTKGIDGRSPLVEMV